MVNDAVVDLGDLDYSITAAGAVLDTLALLSGSGDALGSGSRVCRRFAKYSRVEGSLGVPTAKCVAGMPL